MTAKRSIEGMTAKRSIEGMTAKQSIEGMTAKRSIESMTPTGSGSILLTPISRSITHGRIHRGARPSGRHGKTA